jgi:hypothetical protein
VLADGLIIGEGNITREGLEKALHRSGREP